MEYRGANTGSPSEVPPAAACSSSVAEGWWLATARLKGEPVIAPSEDVYDPAPSEGGPPEE
jgi:hypothetical protein